MTGIPFPTSTAPGRRPAEGGGRLINAYAEKLSSGASAQTVIRRAPGLVTFCETSYAAFRGAIYVSPYIYAAFDDKFVTITSAGVVTEIGDAPGDGTVYFARNNKVPVPDIVAVADGASFLITSSSVTDLGDADLPDSASVCSVDGYFMWAIADGRAFASGINDTTVSSLDFAKAESNPDGLLRGIGFRSQLYLCGSASIEIWSNTGNATGFPFTRATVLPRGLIGADAIAGQDDGFSKQVMFVGDDCQVYALDGYNLSKISTPDLDYIIQSDAAQSAIRCWCYTVDGHPCLVVSGSTWTWVYDLQTSSWHERQSYNFTTWRAHSSVYAFGKWLAADTQAGDIRQITETAFGEAGAPLVFEVTSAQASAFPNRVRVQRADFDFVVAPGVVTGSDPTQTNPVVRIDWSDDGGALWGLPVVRALGRQGEYQTRVTVAPCGLTGAKGRVWRLRVSDPVYAGLLSGDMTAAPVKY
jgi:hypothetical protein